MEIWLIFIPIILGIVAGIITGLIPGIHINLISMLVLVNFVVLLEVFDLSSLIIFIVVMGTVHTFIDFIPSVLFGVPSSDTALSVLPAHKLVLEGRAYQAIFLSAIGSFSGMIFAYSLIPLFYFHLESIYEFIKPAIPYILLFALIALIILEKKINKIVYAILIVLFSGSLGMLTLNTDMINQPLLILFTGLFGIAGIFHSIKNENSDFPIQNNKINFKPNSNFFKSIFIGGICSTVCSISPGIGNSQAGTLASIFFKKIESDTFIIVVSAINTINFILSFLTFYLIDRARNGAVYVISQLVDQISIHEIIKYFLIIGMVSILALFLTLYLGKKIIKIISYLNFEKINYSILIFLIVLVYFMTNIYGLMILLVASAIGILCISLNVRRVHMMSVLLIPVILNLI